MKHLNYLFHCAALALALLSGPLANAATTTTYYHNDLLGSPVAATDASGHVIWRESYRPYGERLTNDPASTANDVWYTSRRQDADTGLVYMGARYYDPVAGRFVSKDPVGFDEGNIQSFNRYAYANNNPYRFIDPTGQEGVDTLWMDDKAPLVVTAQSFGALAAYIQGVATGNDDLENVASEVLQENRQNNANMALMLMSMGRGSAIGADLSAREGLNAEQLTSLSRFERKLPGADATKIFDLPSGGKAFQADVPGKVPGSSAQYEKQVDAAGKTVQYTKTTFDPQGAIVHVKDKIANQTHMP